MTAAPSKRGLSIFSDQGRRLFRRLISLAFLCAAAFAALRLGVCVIMNSAFTYQVAGSVSSPSGGRILTIYDFYGPLGFQGGTTVFNLRLKDEPIDFVRNGYWSGHRLIREGDVAVIGGSFYPFGVRWTDEHHLRLEVPHLPGYRYKWAKFDSKEVPMFEKFVDQWKDVAITYELIGSRAMKDEVRVGPPGSRPSTQGAGPIPAERPGS